MSKVNYERWLFRIVAAIGLVAAFMFADRLVAQNDDWQSHRLERCRGFAMLAVNLLYSHRELQLPWDRIHVDPGSEPLKAMVIEFGDEQPPKALYDKVLGECLGNAT